MVWLKICTQLPTSLKRVNPASLCLRKPRAVHLETDPKTSTKALRDALRTGERVALAGLLAFLLQPKDERMKDTLGWGFMPGSRAEGHNNPQP